MAAAQSLYRRYRPRRFADVVGQDHIVRTLRNAVEQNRLHHAYLFVGSRGTGKTSMAKILAACLNCQQGPTTEPCGQCEACTGIMTATSIDVIEMDAASQNSVDDIRELRDKVAYAPVGGHHKVYILDEAHMLSSAAWNAFLKTLEEPPPNTIFVLATTEAQKVLPTVVDRCHRFDFGRPTVTDIATVLQRVAEQERIELAAPAATLIARYATGSFRDALGTLEQLVTYSAGRVELKDVLDALGIADTELLFELLAALQASDRRVALLTVAKVAESGRDLGRFLSDLEAHARALLIVQTLDELPDELKLTDDYNQRLQEQAQVVDGELAMRLLERLARGLEAIKAGADPRVTLELLALRLSSSPNTRKLHTTSRTEPIVREPVALAPTQTPPPPQQPESSESSEPLSARAEEAPIVVKRLPQDTNLAALVEQWPAVLASVQTQNSMLAALLKDAQPTALENDALTITFPQSAAFLKRKAEDMSHRESVMKALVAVTDSTLALNYELDTQNAKLETTMHTASANQPTQDWTQRFIQEFDAQEIHEQDGTP